MFSTNEKDLRQANLLLTGNLERNLKTNNKVGEIWTRYQLAFWGRSTGNVVVFSTQLETLLRINDRIKLWPPGHSFRLRIINALAVALDGSGDVRGASLYIDQAISAHEKRGDSLLVARRKLNKAKFLRKEGKLEQAIQIYDEIIPLFKRQKRVENHYSALNNLSNIYGDKQAFEMALNTADEALNLKINQVGNVHDHVAVAYINIGNIYQQMGELEEAQNAFIQAKDILFALNRRQGSIMAKIYRHLADLAVKRAQWGVADSLLLLASNALEIYTSDQPSGLEGSREYISDPLTYLSTQLARASLYGHQVGRSDVFFHKADSLYSFCIDYVEAIRFDLINERSKEDLQLQATAVYSDAIEFYSKETRRDRPLEKIFQLIEKSKSYALKNHLAADQLGQQFEVPSDILMEERRITDELLTLRSAWAKGLTTPNFDSVSTKSAFYDLHEERRLLQERLKNNYPKYFLEKFENKSASFFQIQKGLRANEYLLDWHLLEDKLICIKVSRDGPKYYEWKVGSTFPRQISELVRLAADPKEPLSVIVELLKSESFQFLSTLLKEIPANSHLIIIPHRDLASLPFELLLYPSESVDPSLGRNIPYLFKYFDIRYAYSASHISPLAQTQMSGIYLGAAPMSNADQEGSSGLPALPHSRSELMMAAQDWPSNLLFAKQATKTNFLQKASESSILHLATHAIIDHNQPLIGSRLIFFDDSKTVPPDLYAHELYQLDLDADLAVLSACNTGIGREKVGEGMLSLARAFNYAQCPNLVTSLWSVDDQSTAKLMSFYFEFLRDGRGISDALTSAKIEFLKSVPLDSDYLLHPYYWAGFIAIGSNQIIVRSFIKQHTFPIISILIFLVLLVWFLVRATEVVMRYVCLPISFFSE